jgi:hypothetical protein
MDENQNGSGPTSVKKRDGIANHWPWPRLLTDDGVSVPAYERRCRRVVPGRSGCAERAAERPPAGSPRR